MTLIGCRCLCEYKRQENRRQEHSISPPGCPSAWLRCEGRRRYDINQGLAVNQDLPSEPRDLGGASSDGKSVVLKEGET